MRAKKTETQVRKEQISEAALELVNSRGIASLSMSAIARRVGIVPSALYRHFESKEEVIDAVLQLLENRLLHNVAEACTETSDALSCLRSVMFRHARMLEEIRAVPYVVFSDSLYAGDPERKAKVRRTIGSYLVRIQDIVRRGQDEGRLRLDIAPRTAAMLFLGTVLPAAILSNLSEDDFDMVGHVTAAWPVFERAVAL